MFQVPNRYSIVIGFVLSLISIGINSVVISYVNGRLKNVDDENSRLAAALERQATGLDEADSTWDRYRLMHNLVWVLPRENRWDGHRDSVILLNDFLTKLYAAVNDITKLELQNVEIEEADPSSDEKRLGLMREMITARDSATQGRLAKELDDLDNSRPAPKSELASAHRVQSWMAALGGRLGHADALLPRQGFPCDCP